MDLAVALGGKLATLTAGQGQKGRDDVADIIDITPKNKVGVRCATQPIEERLKALAGIVQAGLKAIAQAESSKLAHTLSVGEALTAAKVLAGHGGWLAWLETCGGLSARSATDYMRLFAHRDQIETYRQRAADLTVRGALRLIGAARSCRPRSRPSALSTAWRAASPEERAAIVAAMPVAELLAMISNEQRREIDDRVFGLHARIGDHSAWSRAMSVARP